MELHSPTAARKLWNVLRIAFFMMRKGLVSKRKLMLDMNLMMKRGKILGKSLGNLISHRHHRHHHHHHHHHSSANANPNGHNFGLREYEFSCTNSPNPISLGINSRRKYSYFPCINATPVDDETDHKAPSLIVLPRIEYSPQCTYNLSELAAGERRTPIPSPFSVRVSNFSLAEEGDGLSCEVDNQAEEFIKRFYQQLNAQGRIAVQQYQEEEYQEMLARGI